MPTYRYKYPRPAVTVDLVVFSLRDDELCVLLVERRQEPFAGHWAIPGGFLNLDEPAEAGARRELNEETGVTVPGAVSSIGFFDAPGRDPRGRTISLAHVALVRPPIPQPRGSDDARRAAWIGISKLGPLAFDHDAILSSAVGWLLIGIELGVAGIELLPRTFSDEHVRSLFRAVHGTARDALPWRKRMLSEGEIIAVKGKSPRYRRATMRKRPSP
jgi:8-oxo-dGTP diphosphatase